MAGIRFPGTHLHHGWLAFGGVTGGFAGQVVSAPSNYIFRASEAARVYLAPSRYSEVKRLYFTVTFRHEQTGATPTWTFSPRIAPSSSSSTVRTIESASIAPSSNQVTTGVGSIWSATAPNAEAAFYQLNGTETAFIPRPTALSGTTDAQCLTVEFDRDNPLDADFWADWDAIAALADDDQYLAYWVGIQRNDLVAFSGGTADPNRQPTIIGAGATVIQAPSPENNCCTTIPATNGLYPDNQVGTAFTGIRIVPFTFLADEWDNIESMHLFLRQTTRNAAVINGDYTVRVRRVDHLTLTVVDITTESFGPGASGSNLWVQRTADLKAFLPGLTESQAYVIDVRSDSGFGNQNFPWGWWEIIQKDASRKTTFHPAGMGNAFATTTMEPGAPPPDAWGIDQSVFDPDWYEFLPDSSFIARRWYGGFTHYGALGKDVDQKISLNPSLSADIPNSAGNVDSDEVSSTPDVDDGVRLGYIPIVRYDPLMQSGLRVMKLKYGLDSWITGTDDQPGASGFAYAFEIGSSEIIDIGPVFAIGAFNPEGCASTAAGLGDSPGVLVLANGSTRPKKFDPREGAISNAGMCPPFRDQEPSATTASVALSPEGGLTPGIYAYRYTLRNCCTGKESDPNPVDIVVDGSGESPGLEVTLNFNAVLIPGDVQICEICVYRTIVGGDFPVMAKVGCFDPDTTTVFVDILPDTELDFVNDSLSVLNGPPPCAPVVAEFRNRLFMLGDIPQHNPPGTVSVELDSDLVAGDPDTEFDCCTIGKFIQIEGDCTAYEVTELLAAELSSPQNGMILKLDRPYEGATDSGLSYILCGHPNRLYISEPLEPEYWPAVNFLDVDPGDGDQLTAMVSNFNRLVIMKRRKTYVVAFREQPISEIIVPTLISKDIGCISPRSVAQVASGSVWLSDRGLALYDGRGVAAVPECSVMNDLFVNPENPNYLRRDSNGRAIGAAAVFYPKREQYLLLLPTVKTERGASMILVWDTELRNVTLLEFCQEFLSIEVARDAEGNERVYLGDTNGFVWIWDIGDTDGVGFPNATGTVRGVVTDAGIDQGTGASYLEDSGAGFFPGGIPGIANLSGLAGTSGLTGESVMGLAGACVFWRPAGSSLDTPWQSRTIYLSTSTRLYVTPNWAGDTPSVGDEYMIGPIRFLAEFKPSNYGTDDYSKRDWRQVVVHEPEEVSTELRTELLRDFQNSDIDEDTVTNAAGETGEGRTFDLGFGYGRQIRPVGRTVHEYMGVRLTNFAPEEPLTIVNHLLMMNPRTSR